MRKAAAAVTRKAVGKSVRSGHAQRETRLMTCADALCRARGLRFTAIRQSTYTLLLRQRQPVSAYRLLEMLERDLGHKLAPLTVYRALDFLLGSGLIHKLESTSEFLVCDHPDEQHQSLYLVCTDCGGAEEVAMQAVSTAIEREARQRAFRPRRQIVEVQGLCKRCDAA
jgi:Fur family zinc uptake transcriptional regulator